MSRNRRKALRLWQELSRLVSLGKWRGFEREVTRGGEELKRKRHRHVPRAVRTFVATYARTLPDPVARRALGPGVLLAAAGPRCRRSLPPQPTDSALADRR